MVMTIPSPTEIYSSRLIAAPLKSVYQAFANPQLLQQWWGPHGFTNTFHTFDLRPGGKWALTMHGPEKGHYKNSSIFNTVDPQRLITWTRISPPRFNMEVGFEPLGSGTTRISFRMIFESPEMCAKIRPFAEPKNEENFDRLQHLLSPHTNH